MYVYVVDASEVVETARETTDEMASRMSLMWEITSAASWGDSSLEEEEEEEEPPSLLVSGCEVPPMSSLGQEEMVQPFDTSSPMWLSPLASEAVLLAALAADAASLAASLAASPAEMGMRGATERVMWRRKRRARKRRIMYREW